ncbi:carbohydrate kinase family protein [Methylogaea oryzae]|uniref:Sulfofructose kinase n=1 Tax=Methylogaea oryzae TaxID=1295382 RepID=A0A8D4VPQ1_9GAMM|nr:PfkB family carbohydrate kinase [Methylogaea oryzae]BBL71094.1 sulfofructose kinase [Methylogaea oryzae]
MSHAVLDVLCVGHASYDLIFQVPHHPAADEKSVADGFLGCGGGPAANAAVTVNRAGGVAAFAGYLGNDLFGQRHLAELTEAGVHTDWVVRGDHPTPLSAILVKPDGRRALVNYKGETRPLPVDSIDFSHCRPQAILFDGHEPHISPALCLWAKGLGIPTVLDAGSLHPGTETLQGLVDHLVCSEKFALQATGIAAPEQALEALLQRAPVVVITLGERGLLWARRGDGRGSLGAYPVAEVDTTGAGDAFHGAYALCVAEGRDWDYTLRYASATAALACAALGARPAIPRRADTEALMAKQEPQGALG